uniref:Uncharacterized protein n=1 Tax=Romanomermis culicivorax TaxID=13658 RepID=A0A915JT85_ROMCU
MFANVRNFEKSLMVNERLVNQKNISNGYHQGQRLVPHDQIGQEMWLEGQPSPRQQSNPMLCCLKEFSSRSRIAAQD